MPLQFMLDTNICIYIAKNKPQSVLQKFSSLNLGEVGMSVITHGELIYGAQKSTQKAQSLDILHKLTGLIVPLLMPQNIAVTYADLRYMLEKKGLMIGNNDLWIAAHALSLDVVLVTNNLREFARVPGLQVENWV